MLRSSLNKYAQWTMETLIAANSHLITFDETIAAALKIKKGKVDEGRGLTKKKIRHIRKEK
jgi:hypothetical protein